MGEMVSLSDRIGALTGLSGDLAETESALSGLAGLTAEQVDVRFYPVDGVATSWEGREAVRATMVEQFDALRAATEDRLRRRRFGLLADIAAEAGRLRDAALAGAEL
jgi:hypothetical protein